MAAGDEVAEGDAFDFHRHEGVAEQEGCADYHVEPGLTFNRYEFGEYPHGNRRKEVEGEPADAVADGELDAPEGVAHGHHCAIAGEGGPGASHVAVAGHEQDVEGDGDCEAEEGEPHAVGCLVGQLIPQGEVEEYPEEEFRHHDDGHYLESAEVGGGDEVAQDVDVEHDGEKDYHREYDEIFHGVAVALELVFSPVFGLGEDEWLVGEAEGLDEHHHDDGDFEVGAIDAELAHGFGLVGEEQGEEDGVEGLVHDACEAEHEQRGGVGYHLAPESGVESVGEAAELGDEQEHVDRRADEVGEEDVADAEVGVIEP